MVRVRLMRAGGGMAAGGAIRRDGFLSPPGEIELRSKLNSTDVCVVQSGWACAYIDLEDGRKQVLSLILPGEEFSHYIKAESPLRLRIEAITPLQWWRASSADIVAVEALHKSQREFQARLLMQAVRIGRMTALEAICSLFVEIFDRLGITEARKQKEHRFPLSQPMIADMLGLSSVHVNRQLQELKAADILIKGRHHVTVRSFPKLIALARGGLP